eukprot:11911677-Prorocentrum_lima.AAC.1
MGHRSFGTGTQNAQRSLEWWKESQRCSAEQRLTSDAMHQWTIGWPRDTALKGHMTLATLLAAPMHA